MTDIFSACAAGDRESITAIIAKDRANASAKDSHMMTPLHHLAKSDKVDDATSADLAKLLIDGGAYPSDRNLNGIGALHIAAKTGKVALCKVLCEHGPQEFRAEKDARTRDGKTPADWAVSDELKQYLAV